MAAAPKIYSVKMGGLGRTTLNDEQFVNGIPATENPESLTLVEKKAQAREGINKDPNSFERSSVMSDNTAYLDWLLTELNIGDMFRIDTKIILKKISDTKFSCDKKTYKKLRSETKKGWVKHHLVLDKTITN